MDDVRLGYKRSQVGVIPEDWDVKLLPEVCRFRSGKAHEQYISDDGRYVCVNSKFISTEGAVRKLTSASFCTAGKGDVLMVMSDLPNGRALAKAYLVEANDAYAVNQRVCALTPIRDCPEYLFYVLNRNPYFLRFDDGVNQTHLLNRVFQNCPLAIPRSFNEQRAIGTALVEMDALLKELDRLIRKKRDVKQAAMQQLLTGQTRLPGFAARWEPMRLGNLLRFQVGFPFSSRRFNEKGEGIRLVRNRDLKSDDQIVHYSGKYDQAYLVQDGDVLVGMDGDFLPCKWSSGTALLNQRVGRIVPKRGLDAKFAYYALIEPLKAIQEVTSSTTVKHLSHGDVEDIENLWPCLSEQAAISAVLSDMDAELAALEARLEKTRALRQAMLQALLTGSTRLAEPERANA